MKISSSALMLAAALGVVARPSGHGHGHVHRSLEKRLDFVINEKPEAPAPVKPAAVAPVAVKPAPAPMKNAVYEPPTPVAFSPPPPPPPPSPASSQPTPVLPPGSGSGGRKQFCGHVGKRATLAQIAYKGNLGTSGNYGCNTMLVDNPLDYDYSISLDNKSGKTQKCVAWLKIGPDGQVNGFQKGNQVLSFDLPPNGKKHIVTDTNTQGAVACSPDSIQYNQYGQFAATWMEFDFANTSNQNWSGADVSCLVAAAGGLPIQAMTVCSKPDYCSIVNSGGSGTNAYLAGMEQADGIGLNLAPGPVHLDVTVG
ncbi:hypothetical protein E4U21_001286 [Claviceps maximensis]|nr:hypothetical protein E4U21_001286 [Claviceps maximensis]